MATSTDNWDPIIIPFLEELDEKRAEHELKTLVLDHIVPIIKRIIRARTTVLPEDDILGARTNTLASLIKKLREARAGELGGVAISNFGAYTNIASQNAIYAIYRKRAPERAKLAEKLTDSIGKEKDNRLAEWDLNGLKVVGLKEWRNDRKMIEPRDQDGGKYSIMIQHPILVRTTLFGLRDDLDKQPCDFLFRLLSWLGRPVNKARLTDTVFIMWNMKEKLSEVGIGEIEIPVNVDPLAIVLIQERLRKIFDAIRSNHLSTRQASAFLLGLEDFSEFITIVGASDSDVAEIIQMQEQELAKLWWKIPLPDSEIATILRVPKDLVKEYRQQAKRKIANLEKRDN